MVRLGPVAGSLALLATIPLGSFRPAWADAPGGPVEYNRDVRPILAENCFGCHGPDKASRAAGLRLDRRAAAVDQGAIAPGRPDESELIARVASDDADEVMPPPDSAKALTSAQKETLRRWVAEGAAYQAHWAYEPIRAASPPAVADPARVRNPVDAFILDNLQSRGIAPSPEADRATLLRRLSLDLIGLPPTPAEVAAFEADAAPDAYERQVDRLLASPHFGERMAVPWLDLVRFADTVGYHGDQNVNVFPYRDYVVAAFNGNKPFDRFTREQIAGDLLPDATPETRTASAFNRLNMVTREGGAQPREYLAKYAGDRIRTVAITWLGSTMGCAECHDHKFDPFTSRDFYRMAAFFADVEQWGVYADYAYTPNPDLRGVGNDHPFPPEIDVDSPALLRRLAALDARRAAVIEAAGAKVAATEAGRWALAEWSASLRSHLAAHRDGWAIAPATPIEGKDAAPGASARPDGSFRLSGPLDTKLPYRFRLDPPPGWVAAIRLELLPDPESDGRVARAGRPYAQVRLDATLAGAGPDRALRSRLSDANLKELTYANGSAEPSIEERWRTSRDRATEPQAAFYPLDEPVFVPPGGHLIISLRADSASLVRLGTSPVAPDDPTVGTIDPALVAAIGIEADAQTPEQARAVRAAFVLGTDAETTALAEVRRLDGERRACHGGRARVVVAQARREPLVTRVLPRGNWLDESGEVVTPGVPHFLPQPGRSVGEAEGRRLNRLDLADWLTAPSNPLTARVFVNRAWRQFFGTGLAAVMEDVGSQGEWPSHPELLDWLAADFRDHGWDVKRLVRTLVTSGTYRQSSKGRPELRDSDPGNRWLAGQSPRRLDAEFVRDNALAIAGLLDPELGGPSVFPYQPPGYYAALQFPNRDYVPQLDGRQHRRGLYSHWQRTFLHPMLANFDAPSREECTASRTVANTPQQALTLLNDPCFVEAARALARIALAAPEAGSTDEGRLDFLFRRALARPIRPREADSLRAFLQAQRGEARRDPEAARKLIGADAPTPGDAGEIAAWVEVARVVLNLHETITRY